MSRETTAIRLRIPDTTLAYLKSLARELERECERKHGGKISHHKVIRGILEMFVAEQKFFDAAGDHESRYRAFLPAFQRLLDEDNDRIRQIYRRLGPIRLPEEDHTPKIDGPRGT